MKIVNDYPPNYEAICAKFPAVKENKNVIFTWGNECYVPNGNSRLPMDLVVHENYHAEVQSKTTPAAWWAQYLEDTDFRAQQEVGAYQRQYKYARRHYAKNVAHELRDRIAQDLAGPIYGNMYTLAQAKDLVVGKYL